MPDFSKMSDAELDAYIAAGEDGGFPQAQEPQNLNESSAFFVEQQHPAVSTAMRTAIQAGGGDRAAALRKQLGPDYKIIEQKGRLYIQGKGEKNAQAFDPDMSARQMLEDFRPGRVPEVHKDLFFDNLAEGLQALVGPAGIIPGALGAGAINLGQQGIGNLTGGRDGVDVTEAAVNTALGGTAGAVPAATKAVASRAVPPIAEILTGMPKQATKTYIEQGGSQVMAGTAREQMTGLQAQTQAALDRARREAGLGMETARKTIDAGIDLNPAEKSLLDRRSELEALAREGGNTPAFRNEIDAIEGVLEKYFPVPSAPPRAEKLYGGIKNETAKILAELVELEKTHPELVEKLLHPTAKGTDAFSPNILHRINAEALNDLIKTIPPPVRDVGGDYAWNLMKRLQELNAGYSGMTGGEGIAEKQMIPSLREAGENIMSQLEAKSPDFAKANKQFSEIAQREEALKPFLNSPNPRLGRAGNAMRDANETDLNLFQETDALTGSKLQEGAERAYSRQNFSNPDLFAAGSIPAAVARTAMRIGGAALTGGAMGIDPITASVMGLVSGPKALKFYIDAAQKTAPVVKSAWVPLGSELYDKVKDNERRKSSNQ